MDVIIGKYVPGNSFIHQLDPRTKLIMVFFYVMIVFLADSMLAYGVLIFYVATVLTISRVPIRFILSGLKPVVFIIAFTFVLHLLITRGGEVLVEIGPVSIYENGVRQGVFIALRFILLVTMASLLTLTSTPIEITDGLESILGPLKVIRVPVHEIALMISISLRFIPTLVQETEKIMKAQSARGVEFSDGKLKDRVRAVVSLLVPLFVGAFRRAEELAIAMEARGYKGGDNRTKFRELGLEGKDFLAMFSLVCLAVALFFIRG